MNPESTERNLRVAGDSDLPALLADFDESLRGGDPVSAVRPEPPALAPAEKVEWQRAQACLRLLEEVFPRGTVPQPNSVVAFAPRLPRTPASLGRFVIRRELGRGGFGVVYLALDPRLGREVALKVPHSQAFADPELRERFQREARAAAGLDHPNLVSVFECGEADAVAYIALAYCPGISLADWLNKHTGPAPSKEAAQLIAALAQAVHYAHEHGIVHRDLKPANILLQCDAPSSSAELPPLNSYLPKIADFGLAKNLGGDAPHTQTGTIAGTPSYMAPEQTGAKGPGVGPATDVYALGAILYELLTGWAPFQGETVLDTLHQVRFLEPIPPSRLWSGLSRDLETICLKCLEKDPAKRYPTARALADDLDRFLGGAPIVARPIGRGARLVRWCRRKPMVAALTAALVFAFAGGFAGIFWQWRRAEESAAVAIRNAGDLRKERDKAVNEWERAERNLDRARTLVDRLTKLGNELSVQPGLDQTGHALLEEALAYQQEVLVEKSDDPGVRLETARAFGRVGAIFHTLKKWGKAFEAYGQQRLLLDELCDQFPDRPGYRAEVGMARRVLANAYRDKREFAVAMEKYDEAIAFQEKLVRDHPGNASYKIALGNSLMNSATILPGKDEAEFPRRFQRAVELARESLKLQPGNRNFRQELALGLDGLGLRHMANGELRQAEAIFRETLQLRLDLRNEGGPDRDFEQYVARSHAYMARVMSAMKQPEESEKQFRETIRILDRLVKDFPRQTYYRNSLAGYTGELRDQLDDARMPEIRELTAEAAAHYAKLFDDAPTEPQNLRNQATTVFRLAKRLEAIKDLESARAVYLQVLAINERVIKQFGGLPGDRDSRGWNLSDIANVSEAAGNLADAEIYFRKSVDQFRELADEAVGDIGFARSLTSRGEGVVRVLKKSGKTAEAIEASRGVVADWRRVAENPKADASSRRGLSNSMCRLGELLVADRQYAAARPAFRGALEVTPDHAYPLYSLAWFLLTCPDAKLQSTAEARDLADRAAKAAPNEPLIWNALGIARFRTGDYAGAVKAFEESIRVGGVNIDWLTLSTAYFRIGDFAAARRWLEKVVPAKKD